MRVVEEVAPIAASPVNWVGVPIAEVVAAYLLSLMKALLELSAPDVLPSANVAVSPAAHFRAETVAAMRFVVASVDSDKFGVPLLLRTYCHL